MQIQNFCNLILTHPPNRFGTKSATYTGLDETVKIWKLSREGFLSSNPLTDDDACWTRSSLTTVFLKEGPRTKNQTNSSKTRSSRGKVKGHPTHKILEVIKISKVFEILGTFEICGCSRSRKSVRLTACWLTFFSFGWLVGLVATSSLALVQDTGKFFVCSSFFTGISYLVGRGAHPLR